MRTDTRTIIEMLRVLSHDLITDDGVVSCALREAADRMEELDLAGRRLLERAKATVDRWEQPAWKDRGPTGEIINRLKVGVAEYEKFTQG